MKRCSRVVLSTDSDLALIAEIMCTKRREYESFICSQVSLVGKCLDSRYPSNVLEDLFALRAFCEETRSLSQNGILQMDLEHSRFWK